MPVDTWDDGTEPPSERKVFTDKQLQIQAGRRPRAVSTGGWPLGTFHCVFLSRL